LAPSLLCTVWNDLKTLLQELGKQEVRAHCCARKEARRESRATQAHPVLASHSPPRPGGWMETVPGEAFLAQQAAHALPCR